MSDALSRNDNPQSTTIGITSKIEQMQEQNSDVFAIPDYFVYMSRAFGTLEGIGLSSDPNYSITKECFPYLAKRLISDDSPRARGALKMLLYGKNNDIDLTKLQELSSGFESYTTSTSSVESSLGVSDEGRNAAIEGLANVLLSEESNYVQELLIQESAKAFDTTIRSAVISPFEGVRNLPVDNTPLPLRPLTLPLELAKLTLNLQALDERDRKRLQNIEILMDLLNTNGAQGNAGKSETNKKRPENLPFGKIIQEGSKRRGALGRIGLRFGRSLAHVQSERLRERSDSSVLGKQLALRGADTLDTVAKAISNLDKNFSRQ